MVYNWIKCAEVEGRRRVKRYKGGGEKREWGTKWEWKKAEWRKAAGSGG